MRSTFPLLAAISASLLSATSLFTAASTAQESTAWLERDPQPTFPISPPEAPHRHSSTYQEGVLRGMAALTRANADYAIADGQAGILWEQVEALQMRNYVDRAKYHFEWKKLLANERHQQRIDRIVRSEELRTVKQWSQTRRELRDAMEYPLSEFDVDFQTGMVYWPALVASPRYAAYRQELDQIIANILSEGSYTTTATREQLNKVCNEFRKQLRNDLDAHLDKAVPSVQAEFDAVERLIKGLRYTPVVMAQASTEMISMN